MRRSFQAIGLSLIVLGAMLTIVPTGSYSSIAGDRPVDVTVAGDSEAFVAIIDTNNEVTQPGNPVTVAELENNLNSSMTVEYEASVDTDALAVRNPDQTRTVRQGGRAPLEVTCSPPNGGSGTATLTVEVVEAAGQSATIRDASLEVPVEYDCPGRTAGNRPPEPGQPPGDAVAYVDDDHDYAYDEGERIVPRGEIPRFQNGSAHLVIAAGGETLDYNRQVQIKAKSVTVGDATLTTNKQLKIEAEGDAISFRDSTVDTKNGQIQLKASEITTSGTTITTNKQIKLTAESKALTVYDTTIDSKNGQIQLKGYPVDATDATITTNKQIKVESESGQLTLADATVDSKNGQIQLKGPSVGANGASITTNKQIKLTAESGELALTGATVESENGQIQLKSNAQLRASSAVIETNKQIKLTSSGDMTLDGAEISSTNGEASLTLNQASATLSVDGAVLQDRDATVVYSPGGVSVTGTPAQGSVQAG
jgi:hypothetical protein